jgi:hypothetical protein
MFESITMKKLILIIAGALSLQFAAAQSYTWAENTACIFYTNCTKCHFPGGPGPFSLIDYNSAYTARFAIKQALLDNYMPPWPPDETYQTYAHERLITQAEKDIVVAWVDQGAPQGNLANAPTPPSFSATGSQLSQIDFSGGIGNFTNAATIDDYRCFLIPTGFTTDQYISEIEIIPGNRSMVHHVLIYVDTDTNALIALDNADPLMGYQNYGGTGLNSSKLIAGWVPGSVPVTFPAGMGVKISAGSYIVLQVHYPQGSDGDTDSNTVINLKNAGGVVREVFMAPILNHVTNISPPLVIGANSTQDFTETFTVPNTSPYPYITVLSVAPHMHLVGRSIKSYAIRPGNDTVPLINIPNWDFKWQGGYSFRQPLTFPTGTVLRAEAHYDNTSANPLAPNPNNPVFAGESTTDEMMIVYFSYLYGFPGDGNIIVDTVTTHPTYNGCGFVGIEDQINANAQLQLYPNPTGYDFYIRYDQMEESDLSIKIIDITGRTVFQMVQPEVEAGSYVKNIPIDNLVPGTYTVQLANNKGVSNKTLIVVR